MTMIARLPGAALALCLLLAAPLAAAGPAPVETPGLKARVEAGELPPVAERVPKEPQIVDLAAKGRVPGVHGGTLRMLVGRSKDIRYMSVWGYARLVGYDHNYDLTPDILRDVTVGEDGASFTLHLRRGHRWSDGHPFTAEDFRYWWEDVALNESLSPAGPPSQMLLAGQVPSFEVIDEVTVRYRWHAPNPGFLPLLAQARPLYIYRPAHYMKMYHEKYADPDFLAAAIEKKQAKRWSKLHNRMDNLYKNDNPKLPTLQPWRNTSKKNGQRYELVRNAFFHRMDMNGRQLPYADGVELEVAASGLIALKTSLGEASLQSRGLGFADAPVLKQGETRGGYRTALWRSGAANEIALYPNLNYRDPVWREVMRDVRFRRALSLGISRKAINKVLYFGLAEERAVAALEESPFFDEAQATAWARLDTEEGNRLLDEMGLDKRNAAGIRLLPDGREMKIVIENAGERPEEGDALELVGATWKRLGLRLLVKSLDRDILRNRAYAGRSMMVAWYGWNNGVPTADAEPRELAPVDQANYAWPAWGQHWQTKGKSGEAPDYAPAEELLRLYKNWSSSGSREERAEIWRKMLAIHAEQVFLIGTVARSPVPVVSSDKLRNVPKEGLYTWDPGGQLGVHRIDEFWFDQHSEDRARSAAGESRG